MKDIFEGLNAKFVDNFPPQDSSQNDIFEGLDAKFVDYPPNSSEESVNSEKVNPESILESHTIPQILQSAYDNFSKLPDESRKQLFNDILRVAVKAPISGASSIVDFVTTLPLNASKAIYNTIASKDAQVPYITPWSEKTETAVDSLAQQAGFDTSGTGPITEGVKLATGVLTGGGIAKTLTSIPKAAASLIGSTKPQVLVGAAGAGASMEAAKEHGSGIVGQIGSGIVGGTLAESLPFVLNKQNWINALEKGLIKGFGLDKKNIKLNALESAEKLGIDLPAAAATDSVTMAFVNQAISKLPHLGNKLRDQVKKTSHQFQEAWDDMLNSVAPKISIELNKEAKSIYKVPNNLLKNSEDTVSPQLILNKIKETREVLKSPIHSEPTKKLHSYMNELENSLSPQGLKISLKDLSGHEISIGGVKTKFNELPQDMKDQILSRVKSETSFSHIPIQEVLRSKIELNKIMRDRNLFDRMDTDTLSFLNGIKSSIDETLNEYGLTNPKWFSSFEKAEKQYASLAKRENLEDSFAGKIVNPATQEVSYTPLVKMLEDRSQQKFLKNNLGEENYKKLNDFVNVARAMDNAKRNILNPSSTALVNGAMGLIQGLVFGTNPVPALFISASAAGATKLLTDKRFLNIAMDFAKKPSESLAQRLDKIVNDRLGIGIHALMKQSQSNQ